MATAIVTGWEGLIGSESVQHFVGAGYDVIGLENDMRISDLEEVRRDYPEWDLTYDVESLLREIHDENADLWLAAR